MCAPQMLVSGGVDSTVCAALLHKALSEEQVLAVHIDNGFMRKNESLQVEQSLRRLGLKLRGEGEGAEVGMGVDLEFMSALIST